ncbi:TPA: helix-turn-helix domain-containing protein [Staphylococcus aureus]
MEKSLKIDETLKQLRQNKGVTQEELATKIFVSVQTINKWENGRCLPDAINLLHLSSYYDIPIDELMKRDIPRNMENKSFYKKIARKIRCFSKHFLKF